MNPTAPSHSQSWMLDNMSDDAENGADKTSPHSCTLREALAITPFQSEDGHYHSRTSRRISFHEAITQLHPSSEYSLEEALITLVAEEDNEATKDSYADMLARMSWGLPTDIHRHKGELIVKEVADYLNSENATRQPSLYNQRDLCAINNLHVPQRTSPDKSASDVVKVEFKLSHFDTCNIMIRLTALQLLASTYTPSPLPSFLPAALYLSESQRRQPEMISALRMHSLVAAESPAGGFHARLPSPPPVWPGLLERDREEVLADEVTRRRLEKISALTCSGAPREDNAYAPEVIKEEKLVRWMWDPVPENSTGYIKRLSRSRSSDGMDMSLRSERKGKHRKQRSSSTDSEHNQTNSRSGVPRISSTRQRAPVQEPNSPRTARASHPSLNAPQFLKPRLASAHQPLVQLDDDGLEPQPSSRPSEYRSSPHLFSAAPSNTSPTLYHDYPSPPASPSPFHARLRRTGNFELHPVIRIEPHPVFVQPVKEIAVKRKRWAVGGMNRWERLRERDRLLGRTNNDRTGDAPHDSDNS